MAGGPFSPSSIFPVTAGLVFPNVYVGAGSNHKRIEGLGYAASLSGDAIWEMVFPMPTTLPTGTATFRAVCLANATSGAIRLNPKWASIAIGENPSTTTLLAETTTPDSRAGAAGTPGATDTLVWGTGDNDQFLEARWTMNADTVVAGEIIVMTLTGETTGWTLAQVLTVLPMILFV